MPNNLFAELIIRNLNHLEQIEKKFSKVFTEGFEEGIETGLESALSQPHQNPFSALKSMENFGAKIVFTAFLYYFKIHLNEFQEAKLSSLDYNLDLLLKKYHPVLRLAQILEDLNCQNLNEKEKIEAAEIILKKNLSYYCENESDKNELNLLKKSWLKILDDFVAGYESGFKFGLLNGIEYIRENKKWSGEIFLEKNLQREFIQNSDFLEGYNAALIEQNETAGQKFIYCFNYFKNKLKQEFDYFFEDNSIQFDSVVLLRERYAIYFALTEYLDSVQPENEVFYSDFFSDLISGFLEDLNISRENLIFFNNQIQDQYLPSLKSYSEGFDMGIRKESGRSGTTKNNIFKETENLSAKLEAGPGVKFGLKELPEFLKASEDFNYETLETAFSDEFLIYDSLSVQLDFKDEINLAKTLFTEQPSVQTHTTENFILPLVSLRGSDEKGEKKFENKKTTKESYIKKLIELIRPDKTINRIKKIFGSEIIQQNSNPVSEKEIVMHPTSEKTTKLSCFSDISGGIIFEISQVEFRPEKKAGDYLSYNFSNLASGDLFSQKDKKLDSPELC